MSFLSKLKSSLLKHRKSNQLLKVCGQGQEKCMKRNSPTNFIANVPPNNRSGDIIIIKPDNNNGCWLIVALLKLMINLRCRHSEHKAPISVEPLILSLALIANATLQNETYTNGIIALDAGDGFFFASVLYSDNVICLNFESSVDHYWAKQISHIKLYYCLGTLLSLAPFCSKRVGLKSPKLLGCSSLAKVANACDANVSRKEA